MKKTNYSGSGGSLLTDIYPMREQAVHLVCYRSAVSSRSHRVTRLRSIINPAAELWRSWGTHRFSAVGGRLLCLS